MCVQGADVMATCECWRLGLGAAADSVFCALQILPPSAKICQRFFWNKIDPWVELTHYSEEEENEELVYLSLTPYCKLPCIKQFKTIKEGKE